MHRVPVEAEPGAPHEIALAAEKAGHSEFRNHFENDPDWYTNRPVNACDRGR
jgi:hypothetical protein